MQKNKPTDGIYIGDAPNEVLGIIFSSLPQDIGLLKVASVCKHFKGLVLPLLYRSIRLRADGAPDSDYASSANRDELPPGVLSENLDYRLRSYPDFCNHVQNLSLKVREKGWYENAGGHQRLLDLLPSLKELSLIPPPRYYTFQMNHGLTTMKMYFPLRSTLWPISDPTPFDLNVYLSIPTLRKLHFNFYGLTRGYIHTGTPGSSAVNDLSLIWSGPHDVGSLASVLPSIKILKRFVLEVECYRDLEWDDIVLHALAPHDYGRLLHPHSGSLEELVIAYSDHAFNDGMDFPIKESPFIGTLAKFSNLKRLALPEPFLVSLKDPSIHSMLPPQLEELQIQYPMGVQNPVLDKQGDRGTEPPYRLTRMKALAKNKPKFLPRLKHVVWWFQQTSQQSFLGDPPPYNLSSPPPSNATRGSDDGPLYGPPGDMEELGNDFRTVGVEFHWVSTPRFWGTPFGEGLDR